MYDASAECPCNKKRSKSRRHRNVQQQQRPAPQRGPAQRGPSAPAQLTNQLGEDENITIYSITDHPPKSAAPASKPAAPVKQAPEPAAKPAPAPVKQTPAPQPTPAPTPAPATKPAEVADKVIYPQSSSEVNKIVKENNLVILNLGTKWCGACTNFMPRYKESAQKNPDVIHVKIDAEALRGNQYVQGVNAYPTIKFIKNQQVKAVIQGTSRFEEELKKLRS